MIHEQDESDSEAYNLDDAVSNENPAHAEEEQFQIEPIYKRIAQTAKKKLIKLDYSKNQTAG